MGNTITKESLINEYLAVRLSEDQKINKLITKLEKYSTGTPDTELMLILHSLKTIRAENNLQDFKQCCAIAVPIFEQLEVSINWGYIEFYVLSIVIGYHPNYDKTCAIFQEALDVLSDEEYVDNPKYTAIANALHINITLRMIRAKYLDPSIDIKALNSSFMRSYNHAMEKCEHKYPLYQCILQIRHGVFEDNMDQLEKGLLELHKFGKKKIYKTTRDEIIEYLFYTKKPPNKTLLNYLVGHQLRKRRHELNMSALDIAIAMDIDQNAITAIERGDDGLSLERLRKLAHIIDVQPGYFFGANSGIIEDTDPFILTIKARMADATEDDRNHLLNYLDLMLDYKYPNRK